jgi:hypothetical protein
VVRVPGESFSLSLSSPPSFSGQLGALQYTMNISAMGSPILGCRLILNLRDAYYRPFADEFRNSTLRGKEILHSPERSPERSPHNEHFPDLPTPAMRQEDSMISISIR